MRFKDKIYFRDCVEGMSLLKRHSADIVIADPPYNIGKDFGNQSDKQDMTDYLDWSVQWMKLASRCLTDTGTMFIYGFSEILAYLSVLLPAKYHKRWLIWYYTNKNTPHSGFWQRSHEAILVIWKSSDRIFNQDAVREPYTETFLKNCAGKIRPATQGRFSHGDKETCYNAHQNGALPRDVICVPALAGGAGARERLIYCKTCKQLIFSTDKKNHKNCKLIIHPTQKPAELTRRLLLSCKPKNKFNVLIPFCGSGSECKVVKELGGNFVSYDINKDYVQLARKVVKGANNDCRKGLFQLG